MTRSTGTVTTAAEVMHHSRGALDLFRQTGTVFDSKGKKGLSVEQALQGAKLDWEVEKVPCFIKGTDGRTQIQITDRFGVRRLDTGAPLGVVGKTWSPYQNIDGFGILEDLILGAGGKVAIEAAGEMDGGKKVWILAHVNEDLFIAGEEYGSYLFFMNGHDGRTSVTCALLTVRFACTNQINFLIGGAGKDQRVIRVRHTVNAKDRLAEAAHILKLRNKRNEELAKQGEWLVKETMSDGAFEMFLESLMPINDTPESPAATMVGQRREAVTALYKQAANLDPIRGTRWGALQAVIEYSDHGRKFGNPQSQLKAQVGMTSTALQQRAFELLGPHKN